MNSRLRNPDVEISSQPSNSGIRPDKPGVSGLGGWLILIQISLWLSLIFLISDVSQVNIIMDPARWVEGRGVDQQIYAEVIRPLIWFGFISSIILLIIVLVNLVLLYKRKRMFPLMMIVMYVMNVVIGAVTWILIAQGEIAKQHTFDPTAAFLVIVRSILACCTFIPYFLKSLRVKNTFVK